MKDVQCYELLGGIALKITHFLYAQATAIMIIKQNNASPS